MRARLVRLDSEAGVQHQNTVVGPGCQVPALGKIKGLMSDVLFFYPFDPWAEVIHAPMFRELEFGILRLDFRVDLERNVIRCLAGGSFFSCESYISQGRRDRDSGRNGEA